MTPYVLFFLAGLGFGYAAEGRWKVLGFVIPVVFALGAFSKYGLDGAIVARLIVAVVVTALGTLLGVALDSRGGARRPVGAG